MAGVWINSDNLPSCFVYPARQQHTATVFILHGLGDTAYNFGQFLEALIEYPELDHVKFILPTAPRRPITGMNENVMPAWFDYYSFDAVTRKEDEEGLFKAAKWVHDLIAKEITESNIPSNRIAIGGLSQGGAVSILAALTTERPLAGLFCLSTYVPLRKKVPEIVTIHGKALPILWCHGNVDLQVDHDVWKGLAKAMADQLGISFRSSTESSSASRAIRDDHSWKDYVMDLAKDLGISGPIGLNASDASQSSINELLVVERGEGEVHFRTYRGLGHKLDDQELRDLALWLSNLIPAA